MNCEILPFSAEIEPLVAQLQTHLWSPDPALNLRYLRWKYRENPVMPDPLVSVAVADGRAVAMRGLSGALWEVDDRESRHLMPYADDFVVAPGHRNSGVGRRVMQASLEGAAHRGLRFAVNLSASPVTFVNSLANGWRSAGAFGSVRRGRPAPGNPLHSRLRPMMQRFVPFQFAHLDRAAPACHGVVTIAREPRPEAMAELIARLPWDGRIRMVRDDRYLSWRFRNPLHEYRFVFWDEDRLEGYLVLQRNRTRSPGSLVNIADVEATDDRILFGLLSAALAMGRFGQMHAWTAGACEALRQALREHGFAPAEPPGIRSASRGLLIRGLRTAQRADQWRLGSRDPLRIEDWDLRLLYSMAA